MASVIGPVCSKYDSFLVLAVSMSSSTWCCLKKAVRGGMSAVGGMSGYTYYTPDDPMYADLLSKLYKDIPTLMKVLDLEGQLGLLDRAARAIFNPEG